MHSGAGGTVGIATPGSSITAFASAQLASAPSQMHGGGQAAIISEKGATFGIPKTRFQVQVSHFVLDLCSDFVFKTKQNIYGIRSPKA